MATPRYFRMAVVGIPVYAAAAFGAYLAFEKPDSGAPSATKPRLQDPFVAPGTHSNRAVYDTTAAKYDNTVGWNEASIGMLLLRRWLLSSAEGRTLEVACGTGRNVPYYPEAAAPIVLSDASRGMLAQAKAKAEQQWGTSTLGVSGAVPHWALAHSTAEALPFPNGSFDTVLSTFSLCSVDDPAAALRSMARVCSPSGRMLLLEHGRSPSWGFVNGWLDKTAPVHACKWGCWWNRDLHALLQQAEAQGVLQVTKTWRTHFGMTLWVEATPGPAAHSPVPQAAARPGRE